MSAPRPRLALGLLAGLLALGSLAPSVASPFRRARPEPVEGWVFFSANTRPDLTLDDALGRLKSEEHRRARLLVPRLLADLGLPAAAVDDAVGDFGGDVENSLVVRLPQARDAATLRFAAAWLGLSCRQQAVLTFHARPGGRDRLVTLDTAAGVRRVRRELDRRGVHDRTLVVTEGGCRVVVVDRRGERAAALEGAAASLGGALSGRPGRAEVLDGAAPAASARRYRDAMWTYRVSMAGR